MNRKIDHLEYPLLKQIGKALLKFILFILLISLFFVAGLIIGYAVLGEGNYWEVFNQDTWLHILDFLK